MLLGNSRPTNPALPELRRVVCLGDVASTNNNKGIEFESYSEFVQGANSIFMNNPAFLKRAEKKVKPTDVLNLQFTSGEDCTLQRKKVLKCLLGNTDEANRHHRTAKSGYAYTQVSSPPSTSIQQQAKWM